MLKKSPSRSSMSSHCIIFNENIGNKELSHSKLANDTITADLANDIINGDRTKFPPINYNIH